MKNKHSHPLVCLEGVSTNDLRNMMDYIYNGELQIFQEDLDRFLNVAQRFKLEGLITDPDADQKEVNVKETEHFNNIFNNKETNFQDVYRPNTKSEGHERVIAKTSTDINPENITEVDEQIKQNIIKNSDGTYFCQICGKNSGRHINNCRNHIETHLEGLSFNCPMCEKTFRSRNSLAMHKSTKHRNNK